MSTVLADQAACSSAPGHFCMSVSCELQRTHRHCSLPSLGTCCGWEDANPGSEEGSKLWQTGHGGKAADETGHKKHANSPAWLHGLHQEGLLLGLQHQRAGMGALGCMAACTMARISCSLWGLVRVSVSRGASARRWFASTTSSDSPACVICVSSQRQGCIRQAKCGVGAASPACANVPCHDSSRQSVGLGC